jgi:CubicO group peptidase (beta-lactamase class C family)
VLKSARPLIALAALLMAEPAAAQQTPTDIAARLDGIFARWNTATSPGCAVGVAKDGRTTLARAWGMADLEHDAPNTPATIFEAGSVSKQFTSAAIVLLALDGRLALEDDIRKYLPEIPDYGETITIRHLMTHTSGLRDWGNVAGIAGWPRTTRVHTHDHVLDILSRQRALNFPPGFEYSYSNSGYNLLTIIVDRVSGTPFPEFSQQRIFGPLGMSHTQWRDDHTRIVKGRATAYNGRQNGYSISMPFENVYGNGGLLTTVGDLLIWNENLETGRLGGPAFLEMMHRPGVLSDGRSITYASGLMIGSRRGTHEVSHTGSTAGYRAFLARYPEQKLSVALLCNAGNANPGALGHQVADVFLPVPAAVAETEPQVGVQLPAGQVQARAGLYRDARTGEPFRLVVENGQLRAGNTTLTPTSATTFLAGASGRTLTFEASAGNGRMRIRERGAQGDTSTYEPVEPFTPTTAQLNAYAGEYYSPDTETSFTVVVEGERLVLRRRPDGSMPLTPVYPDAFNSQVGLIRFVRTNGQVTELSVRQSRVYDLRFERVK